MAKWLWFCLLGSLFLGGCAEQIASDYIADRIRTRLVEEIGPARAYRVRVSQQSLDRTMRGRIRWIKIEGEDVRPDESLILDFIHIELKNIDYDRRKKALRRIEEAYFEGRISESHLNSYVACRVPKAEDIQIRLHPERVQASASPRLMGLPVRIWISGKLELLNGKQVAFIPDELSVVGVHLPEGWAKKLTGRLNPLLDLDKTNIPVRLQSLTVAPSSLKVTGTLDEQWTTPSGQ